MTFDFERQPFQLDLGLGLGQFLDVGWSNRFLGHGYGYDEVQRDKRRGPVWWAVERRTGPGRVSPQEASKSRRGRPQQPVGGGARFGGDLGARQHAGDFLAAVIGGQRVDAGGDAFAPVERVL